MRPTNKGGSPRRNAPRPVVFRMDTYLTSMVLDLAPHLLGDLPTQLLSVVNDPVRFKAMVSEALSSADCMDNVGRYAALRQLAACYSKLPAFGAASQELRKERAIAKFHESEKACARTNRRLEFYSKHRKRLPNMVSRVLMQAEHELCSLLGPVSHAESAMFGQCGFGPGLTYGLDREHRHLMYKIGGDQTVTPSCRYLARNVLVEHFPHWADLLAREGYQLTLVPGNRITTVPKTAEIDRTIGIEPSLNVFLQKGVDDHLKHRLKALGLQLTDQDYSIDVIRKYNTRVSTIDLSSASDSVSTSLVKWLLPADWYELLDTIRSPCFTLDSGKSWTRYEKFSSMGNATTFPLESMIFMSLARGAALACGFTRESIRDLVRVYGDDIIVPWECSALLIEVLRFVGFKTNTDKTFVFGPFRETCGVDLLDGVDVRPVYTRAIPSRPWDVAGLFNRLLCNRFGFSLKATCAYLYSLVDNPLVGPAWLGSSALCPRTMGEWYAGKCYEGDAYFFAPSAHTTPVFVHLNGEPRSYYCSDQWGVLRYKPLRGLAESVRYLAFLLGVEGGEPIGQPVFGQRKDIVRYYDFPSLDWWPDCYAAQRPPSQRILRCVSDAVLGETLLG